MLRAGIIGGVSFFLIAATPVPAPNPTRQLDAPVAQQPAETVRSREVPEAVVPLIGNDPNRPIYANVSCEHGCGYFEDKGWLQKLWTDPVATFTAFTVLLVGIGFWQSWLTRESINLARAEFTATQRPKLVIRELHMFLPTRLHPNTGARFVIANSGTGVGRVVESHVELQFLDNAVLLPLQPTEGQNPIGSREINPGAHIYHEVDSHITFPAYQNELNRQVHSTAETVTKIWLRGFVIYEDNNGVRRRTSFCRGYDFKTRRFRMGTDPDYEYAD